MLEILYKDEFLVAINKPPGLLVHRSPIAKDAEEFALQLLRDQISQHVYPAHRLDRKTSGVLLFGLNQEVHKALQFQFTNKTITKKYLAIVRGWLDDGGTIDYSLKSDDGKIQEAVTHYHCLNRVEIPVPFGKHQTSRYSLAQVAPETGRMHQIRKHFAHILHPIIGDRPHGCNKQNRFFKERWNMTQMMLHATSLEIEHPISKQKLNIAAQPFGEFNRMRKMMGFIN